MSDKKDEIIKELEGLTKYLLLSMARIADNKTAVVTKDEGEYSSEAEALKDISLYAEKTLEKTKPFVMRAYKLKNS